MESLGALEIHATHTCNLNCESCSHFSNSFHKLWFLTPDLLKSWLTPWVSKIAPYTIDLLGGEPCLNPQLLDLIITIKEVYPASQINVVTNGFFLHNFPDLGPLLASMSGILTVSIHNQKSPVPNFGLIKIWQQQFDVRIENSWKVWTRRYFGKNKDIRPFKSNPVLSWANCRAKNCKQLFNGKLWKCAPLAYIGVQKETFPEISKEWDPFLNYRALRSTCSPQELKDFLFEKSIPECSFCPEKLEIIF